MSDDNRKQKPNDLVSSYQQTKAPPGFAQRVTANLEQETPRIVGFPRFALGASFGALAIVSLVIVQLIENTEPENKLENELAKTEKPRPTPEQTQEKNETQIAKIETPAEQKTIEVKNNDTSSIRISKEEMNRFFGAEFETDDSSLAVLTDISDWLVTQQELEPPDISDLPAMSDIDTLFETS